MGMVQGREHLQAVPAYAPDRELERWKIPGGGGSPRIVYIVLPESGNGNRAVIAERKNGSKTFKINTRSNSETTW